MAKRRIIGVMTGNSMDAVDVVLTEFDGDNMRDVCAFSQPYAAAEKKMIDGLRHVVCHEKTPADILLHSPMFLETHGIYVRGVAAAVLKLCKINKIDKATIDAIGFHGKTLDHNPPSLARKNGTLPFTTQMGSAQMLADLTGIPVVHDFRSQLIQNGFEGAPLAAPHNAKIARTEGDGCYFNAGNTGNLAWVKDGSAKISWDCGPFNEYTDSFILRYKGKTADTDAVFGKKGKFLPELLPELFNLCRDFYEMPPPKSGDPAFYRTPELFALIEKKYGNPEKNGQLFCDVIHTLEYFSAYLAVYALGQTPENIPAESRIVLFGGGWKNPLCCESFGKLLHKGEGTVLPEHQDCFAGVRRKFGAAEIKYPECGTYMEARLFADLAYCFLENRVWKLPETEAAGKSMVLGFMRRPHEGKTDDRLSRAANGWQTRL